MEQPVSSDEVEIKGNRYRIGPLTPRVAFHIQRKLGSALIDVIIDRTTKGEASQQMAVFSLVRAWGQLSDADADYIMDKALAVVTRHDSQREHWSPIMTTSGGGMMFQDIDHEVAFMITNKVLDLRLGSFLLGAAQSASGDQAEGTGRSSQAATTTS
jgi:Phage tail assembly chaperone protein, TAC